MIAAVLILIFSASGTILIDLVCVCVYVFVRSAASSTTGPDHQTAEREASNRSPSSWSIEEVMQFVRDADPQALAPHAELFRKHVGAVYTYDIKCLCHLL